MKQLLLICLTFCLLSCKPDKENSIAANPNLTTKNQSKTTTYYLIRHAEKNRTDSLINNPNLTNKGKERANNWSNIFKHIKFDAIYTTNYNRTIQTAQPTATQQNIPLKYYQANNLYNATFKDDTNGKTVLIVGHSNTTPKFVNSILDQNKYTDINDSINGNLYIVNVDKHHVTDILLNFN
ncbi:hypothetical protein C7H62_2689 [Mesoflavibacter sp. HG96]|uniref:SixA phosphatase family protein n=1 Tax=Mesoflavibacter TaxID=444051 RepID=UPI000D0EDC99|nr:MULTISPECIES: histidine phosphatase family protein [Mesoflavibacter]QIJ90497.1 hypothetical protein C7H62_2689 [Mesoflavibacter sp. HG96]QIJ93225.1 hypothetical protein C7H56_2689 [Mesoflavibacter sp. HG37]